MLTHDHMPMHEENTLKKLKSFMHDQTSKLKFRRWFPICFTINQVQIYQSFWEIWQTASKQQEICHAVLHQKGTGVRWKSKFYFLYVCNTNHFSIYCISLDIWEPALEQQQHSHTAQPQPCSTALEWLWHKVELKI